MKPNVVLSSQVAVCLLLLGGLISSETKELQSHEKRSQVAERLRRLEKRDEREYRQRAFPLATIPHRARQRALDQTQQAERFSPASLASGGGFAWFNLGPSPINDTTSPAAAGRVSSLAVDPWDASHWLLGAAQGGIWETIDGGFNWSPKTDDQPSLAMGALRFAPSNAKIVYGGTGEGNFSRDSYAGMGLLKSINGGTSWFLVAGAPFAETAFSEIKVHSSDPNILVVATVRGVLGQVEAGTNIPPTAPSRGIFVSHNGGTNWVHTLFGEATDVEIDSANFDHQYAALGEILGAATNGVYRSTNGGTNWTRINGPWTSVAATNLGRIRIAIAPNVPNRLYVSVAARRQDGDLIGIYRTDNAWAATPNWIKISVAGGPSSQSFPWYSQDLSVHPANPDIVYFAGMTVWRFDGSSWVNLPNQHPDQHVLAWIPTFDPNVWRSLVGHDGGVSSRFDNFGAWSSHLKGLAITQFYKGAVDPQDSSILLGGTQDNGTPLYSGVPGWSNKFGGDGFSCAIASYPNDKSWWAVSHQLFNGGTIFRTTDGGKNFNSASFGIDPSTIDFFIDFEKHPSNDDIFVAGAGNLWRCESFFSATTPTWTANSPVLLASDGGVAEVTAIAFAPSDSLGATYAYGTHDGQLRLTSNAGSSWKDIDLGHAIPDRYVSGLAFSPSNPQELYVALSGFDEGTPGHPGHLFKTTNALAASPIWLNVSPPVNLPMDCLAINPTDATDVFVGSDIGVWHSGNSGQLWAHLGPSVGMPNVAVFDLRFDNLGGLTAFTHGRGAFVYRHVPIIITPLCTIACLIPWINPGDLVTIELPLIDVLPIEAVSLTAVLRPTGQITPLPGSELQNYGRMSGAGGVVVRQFQFRANVGGVGFGPASLTDACSGGTGNLIFDLSDNGQSLGSITFPFHLGRLSQPLTQDFETSVVPALPHGWIGNPAGGPAGWVTTSNGPPNALTGGDPDDVGDPAGEPTGPISISAFVPDPPSPSDWSLYSPVIPIASDRAQLTFRHSFDVEPGFDGGVLDIAIGTQGFVDILAAGGFFAANGYNATMVATSGPLGGRRAWSADSGGWLITQVNLPRSAAGQNVQLRWRFTSDVSIGRDGWFIDDIAINQYQCVPPVTNPVIARPGRYESRFGFFVDTVPSRNYFVEYKDLLSDGFWQPLETLNGDGTTQFVADSARGLTQRFYRFRVE